MRSIIITILFCASLLSLSAQIEQGMISFNGAINATQQWEGQLEPGTYNPVEEGFLLTAHPSFAYLVSDHFMLGAAVQSTVNRTANYRYDLTFFEPHIRFYINPGSQSAVYTELISSWNVNDLKGSHLDFGLGVNQFIGDGISLETSLNYSIYDGADILDYRLGLRPFFRSGSNIQAMDLQKGALVLGGRQISIRYYDSENLFFEFSPQGGYFFADRTQIGLDGLLTFQSQNEGIALRFKPYLRYYLTSENQWVWFSSAGLMVEHERYGPADWHRTNWTVMADVGTDVFLSPHIALEFKLIGGLFAAGSSTQTYTDRKIVEKADMGGISIGADVSVKYFIAKAKD